LLAIAEVKQKMDIGQPNWNTC